MNHEDALKFWAKSACVDSAVLHAALRLGLFEHVPIEGNGSIALSPLAERLDASPQGTRVLAELLAATGVLVMDDAHGFALRRALAPPLGDDAFVKRLRAAARWWGPVGYLPTAVRSGGPVQYGGQTWDVLGHYAEMFPAGRAGEDATDGAAWLFDRAARHFLRTQALICAAKLDLFTRLGAAPSLSTLARDCGASPGGLQGLLQTLARLGIVCRHGDTYTYQPAALGVLGERSGASFSQGVCITDLYWNALGDLDAAVAHSRRVLDLQDPVQSGQFYRALARYTTTVFPFYYAQTRAVVAALAQQRPLTDAAVLDVGAGSGAWGAAVAAREPTATVTFLDQPRVLAQTRRNIEQLALTAQARFWEGDLLDVDYGVACFDVIILGQVCHTQRPQDLPRLFAAVDRALRPGGCVVLIDYVMAERRDGPLPYLYFAVKEFASTHGDILSFPEYAGLLAGAGLPSSTCHAPVPGFEIILANRGDAVLPDTLAAIAQHNR